MAFGSSADEVLTILLEVDTRSLEMATGPMGNWQAAVNAGMGAAKAFIGTLAALDVAIVGFGVAASKKAAEFDALALSPNAIEGSASKAKRAISELREIAKGPGLGVESAIETYAGLRRGGLGSEFSMDLTRNIGNAIAYSGGGRDELGRISVALNQIATSQYLRGQDVMQLNEARIPIYKILKDAFGTAETEDLKKLGISSAEALKAINEELAKMPKVSGGAKNTFENLFDAIDYGIIQVGTGINNGLMPFVNDLVDTVGKLNDSGNLEAYGSALADAFMSVMEAITGNTETNDILREIEKGTLIVAYATTNLLENSRGLTDGIKNLWDSAFGTPDKPYITVEEWKARNPGKSYTEMPNFYYRDGQAVVDDPNGIMPSKTPQTPFDQAEAKMKEIEEQARRKQQGEEIGRQYRRPGGGIGREIEIAPGVWIDEDKATPAQKAASRLLKAQRAGALGDFSDSSPSSMGVGASGPLESPAVKFLREIEKHTREMKETVQDTILGGGAATDRYFNARNIAHASGVHASRYANQLYEIVQAIINDNSITMGRAGTFTRAR